MPDGSGRLAATSGRKLGCLVASVIRKNQRPLGFTPHVSQTLAPTLRLWRLPFWLVMRWIGR